jgi:thiamine biosynthesis lipoprotein
MKEKWDILFSVLAAALLFGALGWILRQHSSLAVQNSGFHPMMGTLVQVTAAADSQDRAGRAIQAAFEVLEEVQRTMNDRDPNSELSQINDTAFGQEVPVSSALFAVLCAAQEYSRLSEGAFDITIGPQVALWRTLAKTGIPPTDTEIQEAAKRVGYEKLILNPTEQTVRFAVEGMRLDLGGIAKGYAVDAAVGAMKEQGAQGGMVDVGGNIRCFGPPPPPAKHWLIGIQNPRAESLIAEIRLDDFAVATSGDYRRYVEKNAKRYSHILNPATGESVGELISVTILAPSAMQADALSTAVSVLGREKGLALIESLPQVEAILITADKPDELIFSSGAQKYLVQ